MANSVKGASPVLRRGGQAAVFRPPGGFSEARDGQLAPSRARAHTYTYLCIYLFFDWTTNAHKTKQDRVLVTADILSDISPRAGGEIVKSKIMNKCFVFIWRPTAPIKMRFYAGFEKKEKH